MQLASLNVADEINDGGQAKVFALGDDKHQVLKLYHDPDNPQMASQTLHELIRLRPELKVMGQTVDYWAAWPTQVVEDGNKVVGFLMPRIPSDFRMVVGGRLRDADLSYLAQVPRPIWGDVQLPDGRELLRVLASLAAVMQALHDRDLVYGDVSFGNILWRGEPQECVFLLDCDGICPVGGRPVFPQAETLDWADPEATRGETPDKDRDRYKLALAILRVLSKQLDAHPQPAEEHPLGNTPDPVAEGLNRLLQRAAGGRGTRPTAGEWRLALEGRQSVPVSVPVRRSEAPAVAPKPNLLVTNVSERKWRDV